jgi:hypothetical protein
MIDGHTDIVPYVLAGVEDRDVIGYIAIGFIDKKDKPPPQDAFNRETPNVFVRHVPYNRGDLNGTAVYVLSHSPRLATRRLYNIAKGRLKHLSKETLLGLPSGIQ